MLGVGALTLIPKNSLLLKPKNWERGIKGMCCPAWIVLTIQQTRLSNPPPHFW